jgi:hypothetical protein
MALLSTLTAPAVSDPPAAVTLASASTVVESPQLPPASVTLGFGRAVALHHRSSTWYQIH